ncbi:MAG: hypothetical protein BJ554DRAFT_6707, partial [Olpidium bornovanus]
PPPPPPPARPRPRRPQPPLLSLAGKNARRRRRRMGLRSNVLLVRQSLLYLQIICLLRVRRSLLSPAGGVPDAALGALLGILRALRAAAAASLGGGAAAGVPAPDAAAALPLAAAAAASRAADHARGLDDLSDSEGGCPQLARPVVERFLERRCAELGAFVEELARAREANAAACRAVRALAAEFAERAADSCFAASVRRHFPPVSTSAPPSSPPSPGQPRKAKRRSKRRRTAAVDRRDPRAPQEVDLFDKQKILAGADEHCSALSRPAAPAADSGRRRRRTLFSFGTTEAECGCTYPLSSSETTAPVQARKAAAAAAAPPEDAPEDLSRYRSSLAETTDKYWARQVEDNEAVLYYVLAVALWKVGWVGREEVTAARSAMLSRAAGDVETDDETAPGDDDGSVSWRDLTPAESGPPRSAAAADPAQISPGGGGYVIDHGKPAPAEPEGAEHCAVCRGAGNAAAERNPEDVALRAVRRPGAAAPCRHDRAAEHSTPLHAPQLTPPPRAMSPASVSPSASPPSFGVDGGKKTRYRSNHPPWVGSYLKRWLFKHVDDPHPSTAEKDRLAKRTGLTRPQISDWM